MTKDEAVKLGIIAQEKRDIFNILGIENQQTAPEKRLLQTERYERARVDMHEALNRYQAALALI